MWIGRYFILLWSKRSDFIQKTMCLVDVLNAFGRNTMCGMSAVFSAIFGTPITATIFSMEVISVGVMYYSALVP